MDAKIIQKNYLQDYHFQCRQYCHLKTENKSVCRGKDYLKKFWESLRKHTIRIINFKKKKMNLLTNEQLKMQNSVIFVTKKLQELVKNGEEITKFIPNRLQFIESARFMASL